MATTIRALVALPNVDGLSPDTATNTWHFRSNGILISDLVTIGTALESFYNALNDWWSPAMDSTAQVKFYDLLDAEPRVPIDMIEIDFNPDGTTPLPGECAVCLSYRAASGSGINAARRRGRLYMGPMAVAATTGGTGGAAVTGTLISAMQSAGQALIDLQSTTSVTWVVFSPTTAGAPPWDATALSESSFPVFDGYIDNAWDTQRSRGTAATERAFFTGTV